jgi:hypothetical protein
VRVLLLDGACWSIAPLLGYRLGELPRNDGASVVDAMHAARLRGASA